MAKKKLGYVYLEWTCPNCGTKNPGPQKTCLECGAPQPKDVQFEQAAHEELITDDKEIAHAKAGADIHCAFCGARNPADAQTCVQCGADLSEGAARESGRVVGAHRDGPIGTIPCPTCGAPNPATARKCSQCGASMAQPKPREKSPTPLKAPSKGGCGKVVLFVGAIILLLAIIFLVLSNRSTGVPGMVKSVSWTRSIAIEEMGPVSHDDWIDEIPSDAIIGDCTSKMHHSQDEPDPNAFYKEVCGTPYTVDTGSGHGEVVQDCEYEIYIDWCEYTIEEWQTVDTIILSGNDLNQRWPDIQLESEQQEGEREESYEIVFDTDKKVYTYTSDDTAEFAQCEIGSSWMLNVNAFDKVIAIEPAR